MNYSEKISVIIPVFNTEKYLEASLRSVMNQTYENLEIICVNDGSTDSSPAILERLAAEDSRIRIINQENAGQGAARNAGLAAATSEWVTFPDSDDQLVPDAYETVVKSFEQNPDLVVFSMKVINEDGQEDKGKDRTYYMVTEDGLKEITDDVIVDMDGSVSNKFFKRSIIDKYGIRFEHIRYEDFQFSKEYLSVADTVFSISRQMYLYIRRAGSTMAQTFKGSQFAIDHIRAFEAVSVFMQKYVPHARRVAVEPSLFFSSFWFAIQYITDDKRSEVIELTDRIYRESPILQKKIVRRKKHGSILYLENKPSRFITEVMEFLFAIKYEPYDYKPFKIVRLFGITLMKRPVTC